MRAKNNEIEKRGTTEKINEIKSCFFKKINRIDNSLVTLMKK